MRRRRFPRSRGPRKTSQVGVVALLAVGALALSVVSASTASNTIPATKAGALARGVTVADLAPEACKSQGLTRLVVGTTGSSGNDLLIGTAGTETLKGGQGNDCIVAGSGDDTLDGGAGHDVCIGGSGKKKFTSCEVQL
jgi:Ca2+-binding RTX toxin-like protein